MNYSEINVEEEMAIIESAIEEGKYRKATQQEAMEVRLAALSAIVREMQAVVQTNKKVASA